MKRNYLLAGFGGFFLVGIGDALAQNIDYGSLEALYGEPITTSATGTPQRVSETPTDMTIITADEIRQSGSREIPEILSRVPGLDILQSSLNVFDVGVRGYQQPFQPRLLVLVDGRQVFLDDYSRTAWENIPVNVDDIRQIEVVKGASSALFGSNAAGGVINIVTYSPLYDNNNVATVAAGTQNQKTGDATTTVKGGWGGSKFTVGGLDADDFDTARYPMDQPNGTPKHGYATNSSVFRLTDTSNAFTEVTYSRSIGSTGDPTDNATIGREEVDTYSVRGGINWQTDYGLVTYDNYFNHSYVNLEEPTDGGSPYVFTTGLLDSNLQDQFRIGTDQTFRVGVEYKYKTFSMTGAQLLEPESPAIAENNIAADGTWLWKFNDAWSWTNAARIDYLAMEETGQLMPAALLQKPDYSHALDAWTANSGLVYKATPDDSYRLGYGRGVQLPSLINSGYGLLQNYAGTISDWEGNPKLKPTIVEDYSLDWTHKLSEIFSFVKVGPYYEVNRDIVSPLLPITGQNITIMGTQYPFGQSVNVGDSSGYGGEIQLKGNNPSGFRWDASYSYARVRDSYSVITNGVDYQGSAPEQHYRLLLGYTTGPWEFDGYGQYLSSTNMLRSMDGGETQNPTLTPAYATLSARVGYKITDRYTIALSGENLNQDTIHTSAYPAVQREVLLSLTGRF